MEVSVAVVTERDITEWDEYTGRLEAVNTVEIRPQVSGVLQTVAFTEGKEVKQGELLFQIDCSPTVPGRGSSERRRSRNRAARRRSSPPPT